MLVANPVGDNGWMVTIAFRGHLLDELERTSRVLGWMFFIA